MNPRPPRSPRALFDPKATPKDCLRVLVPSRCSPQLENDYGSKKRKLEKLHIFPCQCQYRGFPSRISESNQTAFTAQSKGMALTLRPETQAQPENPIDCFTDKNNPSMLENDALQPVPELLLQPETRSISHDQLVVEVKGIYAGLVLVEGKCMDVDRKQTRAASVRDQSRDSALKGKLSDEQWQALIALHKTLLHEHHDFFLASQHPSANDALGQLAERYTMPASMWRHGIHAFLEVLRHRLPDSLEHMLAFIYIAYSMIALLYETVTTFENTWIECLGDLGRYRMAIEDDDPQEVWGGITRFWYDKATNKCPNVGRLYHHLTILRSPFGLQQLAIHATSPSCVAPFFIAKRSHKMLFKELVQGRHCFTINSIESALLFLQKYINDFLERCRVWHVVLCSSMLLQILSSSPNGYRTSSMSSSTSSLQESLKMTSGELREPLTEDLMPRGRLFIEHSFPETLLSDLTPGRAEEPQDLPTPAISRLERILELGCRIATLPIHCFTLIGLANTHLNMGRKVMGLLRTTASRFESFLCFSGLVAPLLFIKGVNGLTSDANAPRKSALDNPVLHFMSHFWFPIACTMFVPLTLLSPTKQNRSSTYSICMLAPNIVKIVVDKDDRTTDVTSIT